MQSLNENFSQFQHYFSIGRFVDCVSFLSACFSENSKGTLRKLYKEKILPSKEFCRINFNTLQCPTGYKAYFQILTHQYSTITRHDKFLKSLSKRQLLQGVASFLEKWNAELKYNAKWGIEFINQDANYLETERQSLVLNHAGKGFQYLLENYYKEAPDIDNESIIWNLDTEEIFLNLFNELMPISHLLDFLELHLLFDWSMELKNGNELVIIPPNNDVENIVKADFKDLLKGKFIFHLFEPIVKKELIDGYFEIINSKKKPKSTIVGPSQNTSIQEKENFVWFLMLTIDADFKVEEEVTLFKYLFCPGLKEANISLVDGTILPLKDVFRVTSILSMMSQEFIKKIDTEYKEGVEYYSKRAPSNFLLNLQLKRCRGDRKKIEETLKKWPLAKEAQEEQRTIIWQSKNKISNEYCLIQQEITPLVKGIHQVTGLAKDFIHKVLDIFTYQPNLAVNNTRTPFHKIGDKLCWFPNLVAYNSFADNLVDALISRNMLSMHRLQTEVSEKSMNQAFALCGYKIIKREEDKIIKDDNGRPITDFDVLAYKNGHLFHFEIKLTNSRNSYSERFVWKKNVLSKAKKQLNKGRNYINNHPEKIREILDLEQNTPIIKIHSFILSNSFLFDNELIGEYRKVSFSDVIGLLLNYEEAQMFESEDYLKYQIKQIIKEKPWQVPPSEFKKWANGELHLDFKECLPRIQKYVRAYHEPLWKNGKRTPEKLAKYLNENRLFAFLEDNIKLVQGTVYNIGGYKIQSPFIIAKTVHTIIGGD